MDLNFATSAKAHYQKAVFDDENSIFPMKHFIRQMMLIIVTICLAASHALAADSGLQSQDHDSCIIEMPGDVNVSGAITAADIIYLLNVIFISGPDAKPCHDAGDVNCSGSVTSADVIYLIAHVFKSFPGPCNVCEDSPYPLSRQCYD